MNGKYTTPEEHAERMKLYEMGLSDKQICEKLYMTHQTVAAWRRKNGLKANLQRGVVSMQAYEFLRDMAEKNELCKEILHAVKPRMEEL